MPGKAKDSFLLSLLPLSLLVHGPFVFSQAGSSESLRYVMSLWAASIQGLGNSLMFNQELSFAYYRLFVWLVKGFHLGASHLPLLLNWGSAVAGALGLIPLYLFFVRFVGDRKTAFGLILLYLFAPTLWGLHLLGHPVLFGLAFFNLALYWLSAIDGNDPSRPLWRPLLGAFAALALAVAFRFDVVFNGLFVLLYLHDRGLLSRQHWSKVLLSGLAALVLYLGLKGLITGQFNLLPATFSGHAQSNFSPRWAVKNIISLVMGIGPLFVVLSVAGLALWIRERAWKPILLVAAWVAPVMVIALFKEMDFPRIASIMYAAVFLPIAPLLTRGAKRPVPVALILVVLSQLLSATLYGPITRAYGFRYYADGRAQRIVSERVPLGDLFSNRIYTQRRNAEYQDQARRLAKVQGQPVFVVGDYTIFFQDQVVRSTRQYRHELIPLGHTVIQKVTTPQNTFFFLELWGDTAPWDAVAASDQYDDCRFFFIPQDAVRYPDLTWPDRFQRLTLPEEVSP